MSELKIKQTDNNVLEFIQSIEDEAKKNNSLILLELFHTIMKEQAKMWGDNYIIAFGNYSYTRKGSNKIHEWFNLVFAPRKNNITIYFTFNLTEIGTLLEKLGKHKRGSGCLYINKLKDIDLKVLKQMITLAKKNNWYR